MPRSTPLAARRDAMATPPRALIEHALLLIGRTHKAGSDVAQAAREELAHWRQADPVHAAAAETAQHLWDSTDGSAMRSDVPLPRSHAETQRTRRQAVRLLGVGGLVAALAGGGRWYRQQPLHQLEIATSQGQVLARILPDGTQLDLNARTRVSIAYFRDRRELKLGAGEIRLQVRPDAARPFAVTTDGGSVRVLGTTFSVMARDGRMRVAVAEGRVAVWPSRQAGVPMEMSGPPGAVLGAREAIQTDAQGIVERSVVRAEDVGAWRQGWLVFDNLPLAEAVERWNDYLRTPLRLGASPALRALRLSGSFPLHDPKAFLNSLPDMLPVRVRRADGGEAVIEPR